jgi:hypothetical protein
MVDDNARGSRIAAPPWAARADALLRTDLCPACLSPLGALVCARCGLDVRAPQAADVLEASHRVVDAIAERERLLEGMRRWGAASAAAAPALAPALADAPLGTGPIPAAAHADAAAEPPAPAVAATGAAANVPPPQDRAHVRPAAPAAPRRRISVPAVLLAIGVVLLSVAAVFYVVYAFVTYGLVVRAAITAVVTVSALAAAAVLARRRLPGTAEAVGVVGIVLMHLDVWAVRSYDLGGAASGDPFVHFGVGTLAVSGALLALRPVLRIRAASIAGWAGMTVAAGLLVGAVPSAAGTRTALALAAASVVALVHAAPKGQAAALPDALERGILRVVGVAAATAAVVAGAASALDPDAVPALPLLVAAVVRPLVAGVVLVAGAGVLLVLRSVHRRVLAATAAVALLGAVLVAFLAWRGGHVQVEPAALAVPAIVAVLVAAVGAAGRLRDPALSLPGGVPGSAEGMLRHAADAATGVLVAGTVAVGAAVDGAGLPVALLLSAVAVLVASSASGSRVRRQVGWVGLALGSAALWLALGRGGVDAVEPYVLPPAGVMLVVAALLHRGMPRAGRLDTSPIPARASGAAPVLLGALLLAALPTSVASWTGTPVRAIVLGSTAGLVLLLAAGALRRADVTSPMRPLLLATGTAAGLAVPLVGFGRTIGQLHADEPAALEGTDLWTLTASAVLVLAVGLLPARETRLPGSRENGSRTTRVAVDGSAGSHAQTAAEETESHRAGVPVDAALRVMPRVGVLVALVGAGSVGAAGILRAGVEGMHDVGLRSALLVTLISVVHVVCSPAYVVPAGVDTAGSHLTAPPLHDRVLALAALVVGGIVAAVLFATRAADPMETVTVPIAAALLVVGARRLARDASAGSMRHLTPGLLVLLVPPLLADLGPSPAWRIVGLGMLALATLLAGARLRLRAPFLVGAVVLIVHALAQLWPWIRVASATVPWWAWAGIGGIVLIAVAGRYERRIRDVKEAAARVSALR